MYTPSSTAFLRPTRGGFEYVEYDNNAFPYPQTIGKTAPSISGLGPADESMINTIFIMPNKSTNPDATLMIVVEEKEPSTNPKTYQYVYVGNINDLPSNVLTESSIVDIPGTGLKSVMSQKGTTDLVSEYNVSTNNNNAEYTFAQAVALVPVSLQKGGLTIKYIDSTTYEYVIKRLMSSTWNTTESNWQGIDDEPTAGSNNLVKSGGVYDSFKDITKNFNAVAVLSGTIAAYDWSEPVSIPSGCLVKNIGSTNVNLYETYSAGGTNVSLNAGKSRITSSSYVRLRGTATGGEYKILVYVDTDINKIPTLESGVAALNTKTTQLNQDVYLGGGKMISIDAEAYANYTLPLTIPQGTHIIINISNTSSCKIYFNNSSDQTYTVIGGIDILSTPLAITSIKLSVSGTLTIKFVNEDFVLHKDSVGDNNIIDDSVNVDKIKGEHLISPNLYNKDTSIPDKYINYNNGGTITNSDYVASDFIPVVAGQTYTCYPIAQQTAFYNSNKAYISGVVQFSTIQIPENAAYIRMSIYKSTTDTTVFNVGDETIEYVPYYRKVKNLDILAGIDDNTFNSLAAVQLINHRLWNGYITDSEESLTNGNTISLTNYPQALKKGDKISFYAKITNWGDGITIGKGVSDFGNCYAVINATQLILKWNTGISEIVISTNNHGLTFEEYVKVVIDISADKWNFIIQTLAGTYTTEISSGRNYGTPRVTSNSASLTDVVLSCTNSDFARPIWMFGDSYFEITDNTREMYWLNEWGYLNTLVQGFGGQASLYAYADLEKCLAISKPKCLVWCLGMNDGSLNIWRVYVNSIKNLCATYGITLILSTIPQCLDTTHYVNKDAISDWVRDESDCRYIDVAKAVGSNAQGEWYGYGEDYDYQSSDNVHPSEYGAKAIATQFLVDVPELMQYK